MAHVSGCVHFLHHSMRNAQFFLCQDIKIHVSYNLALGITQRKPANEFWRNTSMWRDYLNIGWHLAFFTKILMARYALLDMYFRAQNTRRHAALRRAAAVICREALKMCGRYAAWLAVMPWLSKWPKTLRHRLLCTVYHNIYFQLDLQRRRMLRPGDQKMHRLQLFSTPWKLRRVAKTKTCREKKENGRRTSGT